MLMPLVIDAGSLERIDANTSPDVARFRFTISERDDGEHHGDDRVHLDAGR